MTEQTIITKTTTLKPNAFTSELPSILEKFEQKLKTELFPETPSEYDPENLILSEQDSDIYLCYLFAMIDHLSGDYSKYKNNMTLYNKLLSDYKIRLHLQSCAQKHIFKLR